MLAYWMTWLRSKIHEEAGQGLVEYALILVLIAIVAIAALTLLGGRVASTFSQIAAGIGG